MTNLSTVTDATTPDSLATMTETDLVDRIREAGASVIVVEQDIGQALKVADRVYCMMEGRVTLTGRPADLGREDIHAAYFGVQA